MISKAILINSKLEGRKNSGDKLALFIRSGPCLKIPRRSVSRKPLTRHIFLVILTNIKIFIICYIENFSYLFIASSFPTTLY